MSKMTFLSNKKKIAEHESGVLPEEGEIFELDGAEYKVTKVAFNYIDEIDDPPAEVKVSVVKA